MLHDKLFPSLKGTWLKANFNDCAKGVIAESLAMNQDNPFLDPHKCQAYVETLHKQYQIDFSYGGWLEDRKDLWQGHYHKEVNTIHLGVDYNVPVNTPVYMPATARLVHHWYDPDKYGGWGGRLVFELNNVYLLFAHLRFMAARHVGVNYLKGCLLGFIAPPNENGGWYPHLHVQCVSKSISYRDVDGYAAFYEEIDKDLPNPEVVLS